MAKGRPMTPLSTKFSQLLERVDYITNQVKKEGQVAPEKRDHILALLSQINNVTHNALSYLTETEEPKTLLQSLEVAA